MVCSCGSDIVNPASSSLNIEAKCNFLADRPVFANRAVPRRITERDRPEMLHCASPATGESLGLRNPSALARHTVYFRSHCMGAECSSLIGRGCCAVPDAG